MNKYTRQLQEYIPCPALLTKAPEQAFPLLKKFSSRLRELFSPDHVPKKTYFFSDAYGGGQEWNPLEREDLDVIISTDFSSRPTEPTHVKYDTFGHEDVTNHFLRLILQQFDEINARTDLSRKAKKKARKLGTGVFINYAPRINHSNASPFWIATARGGDIRVVATPLASLSAIRDEIETLSYLPNPTEQDPHNGLYDHTQQFRSKLTPILLDPHHGLDVVEADPRIIPPARSDWHVSFVDRYGNVITYVDDVEGQWEEIKRIAQTASNWRKSIQLLIGDARADCSIGSTLGASDPGNLYVYRNGGIDFARKWNIEDTATSKISDNAFTHMGKPRLGNEIRVL
jgi:hypothetical protein